ncbi:hypothetical protein [Streptomyces boninensis]|uniref:hypothetical protein n=1 Tax=Streptomyces boninensis TaxID=2039455 RepID=UPI003B21D0DC
MLEQDASVEGVLQTVWDRELSRKPVLLIIIGSDLAMMERLSAYERPFHQRGVEMVLRPLTPWDVMQMTGLPAADAIDAHLITGGLPLIRHTFGQFARVALAREAAALIDSWRAGCATRHRHPVRDEPGQLRGQCGSCDPDSTQTRPETIHARSQGGILTDLSVDYEILMRVKKNLNDIAGLMKKPGREMEEVSGQSMGVLELAKRMDDFGDEWSYGIKQLTKFSESASKELDKVKREFEKLDHELGKDSDKKGGKK